MTGRWYWCLTHSRVEAAGACKASDRLGPYPTEEAARRWKETHEARSDAWDAEDERWEDDDRGS